MMEQQVSPKTTKAVDGVEFNRFENPYEIVWETQHKGVIYYVLQPKGAPVPYWAIIATWGGRQRTLNCRVNDIEGNPYDVDPLYDDVELPLDEWLKKLAGYINSNSDPFP